jgi:hypothetical protein
VRLYSVAVTSLAAGAPLKWTDNLLAHHPIPGVQSRSRGVARGVPWAGVVRIALVRALHLRLGCGVREAVALSGGLLRSSSGTLTVGDWSTLTVDRDALERDVQRRLVEALESAPTPRRGRPARRDRTRGPSDVG